jgi:hypothetical protein
MKGNELEQHGSCPAWTDTAGDSSYYLLGELLLGDGFELARTPSSVADTRFFES